MKIIPNPPIKRTVDGGEVMKDTWAIEQGSRRTGVAMKVDAHDYIYSRPCTATKDFRRRLQTVVAGARLRGEVTEDLVRRFQTKFCGPCPLSFIYSTRLFFPNEGCGRMAPRRSRWTRVYNFSSHSAASDDGEGVSNLWLRECSSYKEPIRLF